MAKSRAVPELPKIRCGFTSARACSRPLNGQQARCYKEFDAETLERLTAIKQGQAAGFTLREIKKVLDDWGTNDLPGEQIILLAEHKILEIDEKIGQSQNAKVYLTEKIARFRNSQG